MKNTTSCAERSKKDLTVSEVCSILDACGKINIAKLKFRGLDLEFAPPTTPKIEEPENSPGIDIPAVQKQEAIKSFEQDEVSLRENQIAELLLTDAHAAEQMLINEALGEENDTEPEEDE